MIKASLQPPLGSGGLESPAQLALYKMLSAKSGFGSVLLCRGLKGSFLSRVVLLGQDSGKIASFAAPEMMLGP